MIEIVIRCLGGLKIEKGSSEQQFCLPPGSTMLDLEKSLESLGFDFSDKEVAYVMDGYGLDHFPLDHPLSSRQVIYIFPLISGG
jgi:molybdopterin converting factor small subunit